MPQIVECYNFDELEKAEKFSYDFFKYSVLSNDFEESIPSAIREDFVNTYQSFAVEVGNLDFRDKIAYFIDEGIGTQGVWQGLLASYDAMHTIINKPAPSYEELQTKLDDLISATKVDADLICAERHVLVLVYHLTKGAFLYLEEIYSETLVSGAGGLSVRSGCTELNCFFNDFFLAVASGAVTGAITGSAAGGVGAVPGALAGAVTGAIGGAIRGIFNGILNWGDCCPDIDCNPIAGVSLRLLGCDPVAAYTPFGFGSEASLLAWGNENGMPETAVTPTALPSLTITQDDISKNTITSATTILQWGG